MGTKRSTKKSDGHSTKKKKKTRVFKSPTWDWRQERRDALQLVRVKDRRDRLQRRIALLRGCLDHAETAVKEVEARSTFAVIQGRMKHPVEGKRCDGNCGRPCEGIKCGYRHHVALLPPAEPPRFCDWCCPGSVCPECEGRGMGVRICSLCGSQSSAAGQVERCGLLFCCNCAYDDGIEI